MVFQAQVRYHHAGADCRRIRRAYQVSTFVIFIIAWSTIVYTPLAHWMWELEAGLGGEGALDFAGGAVVHISSGPLPWPRR